MNDQVVRNLKYCGSLEIYGQLAVLISRDPLRYALHEKHFLTQSPELYIID